MEALFLLAGLLTVLAFSIVFWAKWYIDQGWEKTMKEIRRNQLMMTYLKVHDQKNKNEKKN